MIRDELDISLVMMGWITFSFRLAYALFQIPGGWLGDRFGARRALDRDCHVVEHFHRLHRRWRGMQFPCSSFRSSSAGRGGSISHRHAIALALDAAHRTRLRAGRYARRFAPGRGADAAHRACIDHRLTLAGARHSSLSELLGVLWSAIWYFYYRDTPEEHAASIAAERELIGSGRKRSTEIPWRKILAHSNLWILAVMYFCYNFNLNVYNDWFPTYLHDSRGMTLAKMGIYASLPLFAGTLGDLLGGWFSDRVLKRTSNVNLARRWVAIAGFLSLGRGHDSGGAGARSSGIRSVLLLGLLRSRMDRGNFLGGAAGYRWRFRRFGFGRDEHARQHRRRDFSGRGHLRRHKRLWLECALLHHERAVPDRGGRCILRLTRANGSREDSVKSIRKMRGLWQLHVRVSGGRDLYRSGDAARDRQSKECVECYACYNGLSQEHLNPTFVRRCARYFKCCGCASIPNPMCARRRHLRPTNWCGRGRCGARFPIRACPTNRPACMDAAPRK